MAVKVAINGFGRIGRLVFRALVEQGMVGKDIEVVAVGDIVPADNLAYLLKYDSIQGRFKGKVGSEKSAADKPEDDMLIVNGKEIKVVSAKSPAELPWKALGVDLVIESTGLFTDVEKAKGHHHRRRQEGHHFRPGQGRLPDGRHGRERRQIRSEAASRHFQRELHDELSGAGGLCAAQGRVRRRGRFDDDDPQLTPPRKRPWTARARRIGRAVAVRPSI